MSNLTNKVYTTTAHNIASLSNPWTGSLYFVRAGAIVVIFGNIYSTSAVTVNTNSVILARRDFPLGLLPKYLSGHFISYVDGTSGSVGTPDGYNLAIVPRQANLPANIYINVFAIGYVV